MTDVLPNEVLIPWQGIPDNVRMSSALSRPGMAHDVSILLNGAPRTVSTATTLRDLIRELALDENAVAIERNRDIVMRPKWQSTLVCAGDRIEIVHFVGGG